MSEEVIRRALRCLGKGFDVNCDFRLKYCKDKDVEGRLLSLRSDKTELVIPSFGAFLDVPVDIRCDKGERIRYRSDVLDFHEMSSLLNQKSSLTGKIPSGHFNSAFGFTGGSWVQNASNTQCLALDGYFISLFDLRIDRRPLTLSNHVARAVPSAWDPAGLARFIEKYGTHVIVGASVGGQDVVWVRQDRTSKLPPSELKEHLENLGDQLFTGTCAILPHLFKNRDINRHKKVPESFDVFGPQPIIGDGFTKMSSKQGITVICSKRGGDASANSHHEWLSTVSKSPDVINFAFVPITSLLVDALGKGFLSHAINLYLRYKPPLSDLERFLDFQYSHKVWAPMLHDLPLGPYANRSPPTTSLQFSMMGPKLLVNTNQVIVGSLPVTGMRLHLEGKKNNRLAIHLQHLSTTPSFILNNLRSDPPRWRDSAAGADDERFYEPINNKRFSHLCTSAVKYDPSWSTTAATTAYVVTGAQLHVDKRRGRRRVLCLRLLYSAVSGYVVERSAWEDGSSTSSGGSRRMGSGFFSTISSTLSMTFEKAEAVPEPPKVVMDSGVFAGAPPRPVHEQRMLRFVDTSHVCRGVKDSPGHWLVSGARLALYKGRIGVHVKFALLSPCS